MNSGHSSPNSKRQDRAGHDADREQHHRHLRPALGERLVGRVAGAQVEPLDEQEHRRERDPEAHDRDVHGQRQRLHLARLEAGRPRRPRGRTVLWRAPMKIVRVDVHGYDLRYAHGAYVMSGGRTITRCRAPSSRIETDDGLERLRRDVPARPDLPAGARGRARARRCASSRPRCSASTHATSTRSTTRWTARCAGHAYAKAAIDIACWDLLGKAADAAGQHAAGRRAQPATSRSTSRSRSGRSTRWSRTCTARRAEGIRRFQLKLGADPREDAARVRAVLRGDRRRRRRRSPTPTAAGACRTRRSPRGRWKGLDRVLFEQPCPTLEECLIVRERTTLPMVLDEVITDVQALTARAGRDGGDQPQDRPRRRAHAGEADARPRPASSACASRSRTAGAATSRPPPSPPRGQRPARSSC